MRITQKERKLLWFTISEISEIADSDGAILSFDSLAKTFHSRYGNKVTIQEMINGIEYFNFISEQEVLTKGFSTFGVGGATIETRFSKRGVLQYAQVLKNYQDSLSEDFFFQVFSYEREIGDFLNPQEEEEINWLPTVQRADDLFRQGLFDRSLELLDGKLQEYPNFPILWKARGFVQYGVAQNDAIIKSFVRALDIGEDDYTVYAEIGNLLNGIRKYDIAEKSLTAAIQLKKRIISYRVTDDANRYKFRFFKTQVPFDDILLNSAMSRCGLTNFDGALNDCSQAEKINPNSPAVHFSRGVIQHAQGKPTDALASIKKSASLGFLPAQEALKQISR